MRKNKKFMVMLTVFVLGATLLSGSVMGQTEAGQADTAVAGGALKAVDGNANTITVATANDGELVLSLTGESKIQINGTLSNITQLTAKIGSNVEVEYQVTTKTATSISIKE